jgi:hypothetical protein
MREYFLSPHVYFCSTQDGVVLLDLKREKYVGLGDEQERLLRVVVPGLSESLAPHSRPLEQCAPENADQVLGTLVKNQLLTHDPAAGKRARPIRIESPTKAIAFDEIVASPVAAGHLTRLLASWAIAKIRLKSQPLELLVKQAARRRASSKPRDGHLTARELSAIYLRLQPWIFAGRDQCLLDSLVMLDFMSRYGCYPTWVFGVKTQPFAAHSWVQHGDLVLNDTVEHVKGFTPILTI